MAVAIDTSIGGLVREAPTARVYTRVNWIDEWTLQPYLFCNAAESSAAPSISRAELVWHYGDIQHPDEQAYSAKSPKDIAGQYVRIAFTPESGDPIFYWYGVIVAEEDRKDGAKQPAGNPKIPSGDQTFTAYGLEWFLTRKIITESIVYPENRIGRALPFNAGAGFNEDGALGSRANRSKDFAAPGVISYAFAHKLDADNAREWSALDIVNYLLTYLAPTDLAGDVSPPFTLHHDSVSVLIWYQPTLVAENRSLFDVLNELIDRRRGMGWYLSVDPQDGHLIYLHVFTFTDIDVDLPGGFTLPANPNLRSVNFDTAKDALSPILVTDISPLYDQVVCRGARKASVFTVGYEDGTLVPDWTEANETAYKAGASGAGDYGALDLWEKTMRNDARRQQENMQRVYSWLRLPFNWDGTAGAGDGSAALSKVFPKTDPATDEIIDENEPFWLPGMQLRNFLPMKAYYDYTGAEEEEGDVPVGTRAPFLRPFAIIPLYDGKYQYIDRLQSSAAYSEQIGDGGLDFSCSLSMQTTAPGIIVTTHGAPAHALASEDFGGAAPTEVEPQLSWRTIRATVCAEWDSYVSKSYPFNLAGAGDVVEKLIIDIGDQARLDYLAPNAVVALNDGLVSVAAGFFIRDDRPMLADLARTAWTWYNTPRKAFDLTYRQVTSRFTLGHMITEVGEGATFDTVNCVITSIAIDMLAGTTKIQTQYGEIDFQGLAVL